MPDWSTLRRRAQQHHEHLRRQLPEGTPFLPSAEALLAAAEDETGMTRVGLPPEDSLLAGAHAVLDRHGEFIWYAEDTPLENCWFSQAHEFAHFWLHPDIQTDACRTEENPDLFLAPEQLSYSAQMEIGYSPAERRESEADHFAAEFLLPAPSLRRALLEGWTVPDIMRQVGVSETLVLAQLAQNVILASPPAEGEADLLGALNTTPSMSAARTIALDESQRVAATIERGPLLVEAGPGTGKTRTLVARLLHLLTEREVVPENILALTFSNKAAEEMRTRLEDAVGDIASRVWIGTFHAFGMEVLRKDGHRIGLPLRPKLLETADAILLLERHLDRLALDEYEYLFQPSLAFPDILNCISRAKDELQTPEDYRAAAWQQRSAAIKEEETLVARKSLEVAHFYAVYQELMARYSYVDYGDLIMRSVELLDKRPDVRERWQSQFPHILADEYQDINRASAQFLRRLAGSGEGFWAVGDVRQAIYRFRGASPANVQQFETDFPGGRRVPLQVNYRSRPSLVSLFSATATQMLPALASPPTPLLDTRASSAGDNPQPYGEGRNISREMFSSPQEEESDGEKARDETFSGKCFSPHPSERGGEVLWDAHREDVGNPTITVAIAEDEAAQVDGLAATIRGWEQAGVPLPEQTILCRTNRQAAELAEQLEARSVPTQHLGSLFEREEVKDLLAVLALGCEPEGAALLRVAGMPEYAIPQEDVQALWKAARAARRVFPGALELADDLPELSAEGRAGLQKLRAHIAPIAYRGDAWYFLTRYLFETSGYLRPILNDNSIAAKQKALAIHQLLGFAQGLTKKLPPEEGQSQHAAFLVYLRHLLACGEERSIRLPSGAETLNGVRLMTVHASKGLEFPVVYLPNLVKDMFPTRKMGRMASPPPGLFDISDEGNPSAGDDEAGEDCLFFVALSRARDHLVLSRPALRRGRQAQPSPLLKSIEETLVACNVEQVVWHKTLYSYSDQSGVSVPAEEDGVETAVSSEAARPTVSLSALEQYQNCPRQYYYQRISRVPLRGGKSAYQAFHESLNTTQKWLQEERAAGKSPSLVEAQAYLDAHWMANAPEGESAQARVLHEHALAMLEVAHQNATTAPSALSSLELTAELPNGTVRLRCDHAEPQPDGTLKLAQTVKRRAKKDDHTAPDLALLREAARQQHPDKQIEISLHYLRDGSQREIPEQPRYEPKRVEKYDIALAGIRTHRFPAHPDDRKCPQCPFFFLCPNG